MVVRRFSRLYNHHGTRLKDRIPPFHPYFYNNIIFNLLCHKRTPNQKSSTQTNPTQPIFPFTHVSNFISPNVIISIYLNFHKLHYIVWQFWRLLKTKGQKVSEAHTRKNNRQVRLLFSKKAWEWGIVFKKNKRLIRQLSKKKKTDLCSQLFESVFTAGSQEKETSEVKLHKLFNNDKQLMEI